MYIKKGVLLVVLRVRNGVCGGFGFEVFNWVLCVGDGDGDMTRQGYALAAARERALLRGP